MRETHLLPFEGATGWLNPEPLTPEDVRGNVALVDFGPTTASTGFVRKERLMSMKRKVLGAMATVTILGGVSTAGTLSARAATPACGEPCISIFSRVLGTHAQPNFVEAVYQGIAEVGQPLILKQASSADPSQDLIVPWASSVSEFFAAGMVSAKVNRHYGSLTAVQIEYAPLGVGSGLCVGVAKPGVPNQGLSLQPCSLPATTVWIVDTEHAVGTPPDLYFPLINGSTRSVSRPLVMDYPPNAFPTDEPTPDIRVRHLQFVSSDQTVPDRQLWGTRFGVLDRKSVV